MLRRCDPKAVLRYYNVVLRSNDWKRIEKYIGNQRAKRGIRPRFAYWRIPGRENEVPMYKAPDIYFREKGMHGFVAYADCNCGSIVFRKSYYETAPIEEVHRTIRHEMIHLMLWLNGFDHNHRRDFRKCAKILHLFGRRGEPKKKVRSSSAVIALPTSLSEGIRIEESTPRPAEASVGENLYPSGTQAG
jgi:hypothetical protein